MADETDRSIVPGTIENTRKMLAYLKTIDGPTAAAVQLMRRYEAEIAAHEYDSGDFHDVAGANV